jgi:hypothetical protein
MLRRRRFAVTFWQFLNHWWNLPYLVMLGLVGVFFALQAVGLLADVVSAEAQVDHELDHDIDHDVDHDQEADADGEDGHGLLAFLGVGRVPFLVVWLTLFIFTGFAGLFLNRVLQVRSGGYAGWFFPVTLLASLGVGLTSVRFASKAVGKLVDTGGRGATARRDLSGSIGVVASPTLDSRFGEVRVRDAQGNELIVHGHVGEREEGLRQGEKVVLMELEKETGLFQVAAFKE